MIKALPRLGNTRRPFIAWPAVADERNIDPSPQKVDGVNRLNNRQKSDEQRFLLCQFAGRWATINSIKALGYPCRNAL
ncbi:hypothetical protein [Serratia marcescens]|uniref:hypothetical protein n=1 Tax=Serratia marcescens TaxID=615 RepID=UPI001E5A87DC|nr:hypothetical protein [Serratia marcescens]